MAYKNKLDPRARAARRKHYEANKVQYLERNRIAKEARLALIKELKSVPCMDCGKSYPSYVMDFDHRDPSQKIANVGRLLTHSLQRLQEEINKCDVICANCHRERTHGNVLPG